MVDQPSIVRVESSEALETATIAETGLAGDEDKTTALPEQSGSTVVDGTKTEEITAGAKVEPETDTAGSDVSDAAQEVVATLEAPEVFDSERVIQPDAKPLSDELVSPQATTEGASATDSVSPEVPESPSAALQTPETGPTAAAPTALTPETAPPDAPLFDLVRVDAAEPRFWLAALGQALRLRYCWMVRQSDRTGRAGWKIRGFIHGRTQHCAAAGGIDG